MYITIILKINLMFYIINVRKKKKKKRWNQKVSHVDGWVKFISPTCLGWNGWMGLEKYNPCNHQKLD